MTPTRPPRRAWAWVLAGLLVSSACSLLPRGDVLPSVRLEIRNGTEHPIRPRLRMVWPGKPDAGTLVWLGERNPAGPDPLVLQPGEAVATFVQLQEVVVEGFRGDTRVFCGSYDFSAAQRDATQTVEIIEGRLAC